MNENKLYYYTTIDKLALILDSKAIRFTRLDLFDDMQEIEPFNECNPLRYIFASCHTKDDRENIPLWKMYSSMENGVRIEFDKRTMFAPSSKVISIPQTDMPHEISPVWMSVLSKDQIINNDYMAIPIGNLTKVEPICQHIVYKDVIYDDNFKDIYNASLITTDTPNGRSDNTVRREVSMKYENLGFYKSEYWKFQNESRFLIYTVPFVQNFDQMNPILTGERQLSTKHIDVKLYSKCFDDLKLRLSPRISDSSKLIVKALVKDFPNIIIEDSVLKNTIR